WHRLGRRSNAGRPDLRGERSPNHRAVRLGLHPDRDVHARDWRACPHAARLARPRRHQEGLSRMAAARAAAMPLAILALTLGGLAIVLRGDGYTPFVLALV